MAEDTNKLIILGRLTRDSELLYTTSGYALCKFSLAVNRKKRQGDLYVDEVNYFEFNLWGTRGENLTQYLLKGQQVLVEGQLRQERWENDGMKRSKVTIEVEKLRLLGSPPDNGQRQGGGNKATQNPTKERENRFQDYTPPSQPKEGDYEDDIPF